MGGSCSSHGRYGKLEGGNPFSTWGDNNEIHLKEIEYKVVVGIHLAQDRDMWRAVVNSVMNLWFHTRRGIS